ncbi:hypothetical protein [Faecalispora anaeroviscerum]|uniref:hypothetical protein n=1 Tax=Faecalispora anaeroviscerum TaxID=2991836 RepID=UPI0024B9786A|nr:hypothetical protein [Faecalispora anaeroviscerum]
MTVNPLQDIMNYYLWSFSAYLFAMAIIFLNAARSVYFFLRSKSRPLYPKRGRMDLLISMLCGISLVLGLMFQGVLADNGAPDIYHWSSYLWMICLVSLALFIVQAVFHVKTPSIRPKLEPTGEIPVQQPVPQEPLPPEAAVEQPVDNWDDTTPKDSE